MDTSFEWMTVVGRKIFTCGYRTVEGEEEDTTTMEEPSYGLHDKQKHGIRYGFWEWIDGS